MRFSVPQFIEIEDKIFGPFTFKQFLYLAGGTGISFLIYNFIPSLFIAAIFIIPVAAFSFALAFYKVNDKPFINVVEAAFNYTIRDKLYIWKREAKSAAQKEKAGVGEISYVPRLSDSKLKDLSWSLDVLDTGKMKDEK